MSATPLLLILLVVVAPLAGARAPSPVRATSPPLPGARMTASDGRWTWTPSKLSPRSEGPM
ncbi:hypothetical protein AB0K89_10740 [Streptomyces cinnamoneus]|uniref:hypothetical protein n=1 Tax=Streptomyces cinnamoneus TaxID=53446 RepID=UPI00343433BE